MEADDDYQTGSCSRRKLDEQEMKNLHPHLLSKYLAVRRHIRRKQNGLGCYIV